MKNTELVKRCLDVAQHHKTIYVMGCFGAPLTGGNVSRYCNNHDYNKQPSRTKMIKAAADKTPPVFGFDCVNLIKGILWGWDADPAKTYGGAVYKANGVPDVSADGMIQRCSEVSTSGWDKLVPGEAVWLPGHIGVYIGDGLVVECTPAWDNCVQVTACNRTIPGYHRRDWKKHGKIPTVDYSAPKPATPAPVEAKPEPVYKTLLDVPESYRPAIRKLMEAGALGGYSDPDPARLEDNVLNVTETFCRVFTVLNNLGKLD